jgi:ubiquinol-cytochrome c reductase cytochrome b subunit
MLMPRLRIGDWLEERVGWRGVVRGALHEPVPGGASFAYVLGSMLTFGLIVQMVTGVVLAMYYSPSTSQAWASVAYVEDQVALGWLIRALHHHGASAMVLVAGLHMAQVAAFGAYKKPREVNWIVGVFMLGLLFAFALTGYLLPWDQTGYWATQVATGIAGSSPVIGEPLKHVIQGGNEYGNLTLTRFFAIHVFILPGAMLGLLGLHLVLFRRHGVTPGWWKKQDTLAATTDPFWPDQMLRDVVGMAVLFALVIGWSYGHRAELFGPADPSSNFDARPEWYFRPLFQALKYFHGPMEMIVALGAPVVIGGLLLALPFVDRADSTDPRRRIGPLAILFVVFAAAGGLTAISLAADADDAGYQAAMTTARRQGEAARAAAKARGVPPVGGLGVLRAEQTWASCQGCHAGDARKGPEIGPGFGSRAYLEELLRDPAGERFFGVTSINQMPPIRLPDAQLDALVEMLYAESGAADVDRAKVALGKELFDGDGGCSNCHSLEPDGEGDTGPNLSGHGSAAYWASFVALPSHPRFYGAKSAMPPFYDRLGPVERGELGELIVRFRDQPWPARPDAKRGVYGTPPE